MSTAYYAHPGIYIEEFDGGVHEPIRGVEPTSTRVAPGGSVLTAEQSTAAFLGYADEGPVGAPVPVASPEEYAARFGGAGILAVAVRGYFDNGGRACVVSRLDPDAGPVDAVYGEAGARTGLAGLETLAEVATVCVPDLGVACVDGRLDPTGLRAAQLAMIGHCEMMGDRIAILDPPPGLRPEQIHAWRADSGYDSAFAVLPYPWIKIVGPDGDRLVMVPPSGHLAGSYARLDGIRGFHRAPANDPLTGVVDLETHLTRGELDVLCPAGINPLMLAPGRGVVSWGARTLSSDPDRRYLRRRRLLNTLTRTIRSELSWAVFERSTDPGIRDRFAESLRELFYLYWRAGALDGDSPAEGFAVTCDPPDAGRISAEVRLATDPPATLRVVCHLG